MKAGFFGTPHIASYCLEKLLEEYSIEFVVTSPDKPAGRGRKLRPSQVKELAMEKGIPVLQPQTLGDPSLPGQLEEFKCDIFVVVAYGKLIPEKIFNIPPLGTINLHPSLLPDYRGAAPIQWALINGEEKTGVTVQKISRELDAGDILMQDEIDVSLDMTAADLYDIVLPLGAEMLKNTMAGLGDGTIEPLPQDHSKATYCGKIDTETTRINWEDDPLSIHNLVRGLNPRPAAWTTFREKRMKIWRTMPVDDDMSGDSAPGTIHVLPGKRLAAQTGKGLLEISILQPETKKVMDGRSFINGYHPEEYEHFS